MTATASVNGKPQRKQLSDQLDRLDSIIDCLADALPEAVADATRAGVRRALEEALAGLLTDPDLVARLRQVIGGAAPVTPGLVTRLQAAARAARDAATTVATKAATAITGGLARLAGRGRALLATAAATVQVLRPLRGVLLAGLCAGLAGAAVCYLAPHGVAAAAGGVAAGLLGGAARAWGWLKASVRFA